MTATSGITPIVKPSKKQLLEEKIFEMCVKSGPSAQLPSFRELCRAFGVSKTTLDYALSELEQRRLIVRHHGKGIYTSPSVGQRTVGVVLGNDIFTPSYSPYWHLLLQAAREQLDNAGLRINSYFDLPTGSGAFAARQQLEEDLLSKRLDGLLLIARQSSEEIAWLQKWEIPLVTLPSDTAWGVTSSPIHARAIRALAERGCKRIVWMGFSSEPTRQRIRECLSSEGLPADSTQLWTSDLIPTACASREELAHLIMDKMWAGASPRVDGFILDDDTMTRGVITCLERYGVKVGSEVIIASAANKGSPILADYTSKLIIFEHDPQLQAHAALEMLETLMNGKHPPEPVKFVELTMTVGANVAQACS